jgi:hypothetical protein
MGGSGMKQGQQAQGGSKAPGGRENLEAQALERVGAFEQRGRCPVRGHAVGDETPWEGCSGRSAAARRAERNGRPFDLLHSEGERKPMRGCGANFGERRSLAYQTPWSPAGDGQRT